MGRIAIYVRGQVRLDRLQPRQSEMYALGSVGLESVKRRLQSGRDANDSVESPLNRYYAALKARVTKRPAVRDYQFGYERDPRSGRFVPTPTERQLLPNLRVRSVSETAVFAENTTMGNIARVRKAAKLGQKGPAPITGARPKNSRMQELYQRRHGAGEWLGFSPSNIRDTVAVANRQLPAMAGRIVVLTQKGNGTWST